MVPAVGQGALAIETRSDDLRTRDLVAAIEHLSTRRCVMAERRFLEKLGGGCQLPIGSHASIQEDQAWFRAFVGDPDGERVLREVIRGNTADLEKLAVETADRLLAQGAHGLLSEWKHPQPGVCRCEIGPF